MFETQERNTSASEILGAKGYVVLGLGSLVAVPVALFVAFLDGSEGGGEGFIAKILFPFAFLFPMLLVRLSGLVSESALYFFLTVMLVIAALQFPIYGMIVLRSRSVRRAVVILVAAHFLCVALVFALAYLFSGRNL